MIGAIASVGHEVAVMLQHVEMVIGDDALDFALRPLFRLGYAKIDGLSFEWFGRPVGRQVGDHPVANFWIARIQRASLGG